MIILTIAALIVSPAVIVAAAYSAMIYVKFFREVKGQI